jgi:HK97 gp10 family phage protein
MADNSVTGQLTFDIQMPQFKPLQTMLDVFGADIGVKKALEVAAIGVQNLARHNAPTRTGRLVNSIGYKINGLKATIGPTVPYGLYVEMGTGLYGPKGQLIEPKTSKVLATKVNPGWGTKSSNGYFVIGRYSRGQEANPFMAKTAHEAGPVVEAAFGMVPLGIVKTFKEI